MTDTYFSLIKVGNLFQVWEEFKKGKRNKGDVQIFERNLEDNLFGLHEDLADKTYRHRSYDGFWVNDPKRRHIHKAEVRDRIVHHLLYKYLYALFNKTFIYDSYSCRINKGTHRAVKRLEEYARIVSKNYTQDCWALKLDVKQFFANVDHEVLMDLVIKKIKDKDILQLISEVINSFSSDSSRQARTIYKGIPLGNLTSQIFANLYLNELDQFIKHDLKIKYYIRYADDFIIFNTEKLQLKPSLIAIGNFLQNELKLQLHPKKIIFTKLTRGIDFCGYVVLPHYILPRTRTKRRILKKVMSGNVENQALQSYLGYFGHANAYNIKNVMVNIYWLNVNK